MCTDLIVANFVEAIKSTLASSDLPHFLGGSRRFGYDRPESDIDFFVLANDKEIERALIFGFSKIGFRKMPHEEGYSLHPLFRTILVLQEVCHIVILNNEDGYFNLKREHERIELFLEKEPRLRDLCRELGSLKVKGTYIYRALCQLLLNS